MAYLCVNKDGQELICQDTPKRWGYMRKDNTRFGRYKDKETGQRYNMVPCETKNEVQKLGASYWRDIYTDPECNDIELHIELPAGSIERLIGRVLTWDDEPVEI